ncbi:MAG: hypothetical protein ABI723_07410 [Bacteroidia bacterium]
MKSIIKLLITSALVLVSFSISDAQVVMPDSAASGNRSQPKQDTTLIKKAPTDTIKKPDTLMRGSIYYRDSISRNKSNPPASPKNKK